MRATVWWISPYSLRTWAVAKEEKRPRRTPPSVQRVRALVVFFIVILPSGCLRATPVPARESSGARYERLSERPGIRRRLRRGTVVTPRVQAPRQQPPPARSTPELGVPVQDDGRRGQSLAPERSDEEEPLTVGRDHVLVARDARLDSRREERLRDARFEALPGVDVDRHELLVGRAVEEFLSVGAPRWIGAPGARDLPLAARDREGLDVDLGTARLGGLVCDEPRVRREERHQFRKRPDDDRDGLAVAESRQRPRVPARLLVLRREGDVAPVPRPIACELLFAALEQQLLLALAARRFLEEVVGSCAVRPEYDRGAVGRPDRDPVVPAGEREPRIDAACEIPDPDVGLSAAGIVQVEDQAVAGAGELRVRIFPAIPQSVELFAGAIHPEKPRSGVARSVGERSVPRNRKRRQTDAVGSDVLGQRDGLPLRPDGLGIEALRDERLVAHEEKVTGRSVGHEGLRRGERLRVGRVDGPDAVGAVLRLYTDRHEEEMASIRQELGPADLAVLAGGSGLHRRGWRAPRGRHAIDGILPGAVEENDSLRAPAAVGAGGGIADLLSLSVRHLDLLQLPLGHEAEKPAVGRPERPPRSLRPVQRLRRESIHRPHPDPGLSLGVRRVEREVPSVGRNARSIDGDDPFGRRDLEPDRARLRRRAADEPESERGCREDC